MAGRGENPIDYDKQDLIKTGQGPQIPVSPQAGGRVLRSEVEVQEREEMK